jgi:hypothetical protein
MRKLLALTGLIAVAALAVGLTAASTGAASLVTVASGSFTIVGHSFGANGVNRTEAFTVQQSASGAVRGQLQLRAFSGAIFRGDVNCFTREGNQAIVGGTITMFTGAGNDVFVGTPFAFAIQDNPDLATFVFFGGFDNSSSSCDQLLLAQGEPDLGSLLNDYGLPITTGNILIGP